MTIHEHSTNIETIVTEPTRRCAHCLGPLVPDRDDRPGRRLCAGCERLCRTDVRPCLSAVTGLHETIGRTVSFEHFVLRHGRPFAEVAPARKYLRWMRTPHACFSNALQLAMIEKLVYVEGVARVRGTGFDTEHAWCLDAGGRVLDPTWQEKPGFGAVYFGVPFTHEYANARYEAQAKLGEVGSLLRMGDDDYALVREMEARAWRFDDRSEGAAKSAPRIEGPAV